MSAAEQPAIMKNGILTNFIEECSTRAAAKSGHTGKRGHWREALRRLTAEVRRLSVAVHHSHVTEVS